MRNWLTRLMYGRYGMDNICKALLIMWFGLAAVNIFFRSSIIYFLQLIPAVLFFLRFFSKNTVKRAAENEKYTEIITGIGAWFRFQWQKLKEIGTHRYIKCPECRAVLRVPRKIGKHTAVCPRCRARFEAKIII